MQAFTLLPKEDCDLNQLISRLEKFGKCNCNKETFLKIYKEWHQSSFPGTDVRISTVNFKEDWLYSFINFIANYDIKEGC